MTPQAISNSLLLGSIGILMSRITEFPPLPAAAFAANIVRTATYITGEKLAGSYAEPAKTMDGFKGISR